MRRFSRALHLLGAVAVVGALGLTSTGLAAAKPPTPSGRGTSATITSVTPVPTYQMLVSPTENTSFCVFNAAIGVTWGGQVRLDAYPIVNGTRMPPGDTVYLTGRGSGTVIVPRVLLRVGSRATFEGIAGMFVKRTYQPLSDVFDTRTVACPANGW